MYNLPHYDLDDNTLHDLHFLEPPLDPQLSPSLLPWQVESFPLSSPPVPNKDFGLDSYQTAFPVQENVPSWKDDITESLIRELGALTSDCHEWCVNLLGAMIYYIHGVGEVHFEVYGSHSIQHGFLYLQNHHEGSPPRTELKHYIDLGDKNYDWVKNFIDKYMMLMENYKGKLMKDTLSNLIMARAVGSSSIRESYLPPELDFGGSSQLGAGCTTGTFPITETGGRGGLTRPKKTGLTAKIWSSCGYSFLRAMLRFDNSYTRVFCQDGMPQRYMSERFVRRERIKNTRREDLERYFHLPSKLAAQELSFSVKSLRKVCRENGIPRWPYIPRGMRLHM